MTPDEMPRSSSDTTTGKVRSTVEIAAPPEQVFQALTDPEQLETWWGSEDTYRTSGWQVDPQPGGEWSVRTTDANGDEATVRGEYLVVDPPRVLEYTWAASWDDFAPTTVRFELSPAVVRGVSGTRLTVTHNGFAVLDVRAQAGVTSATDWPRLLRSFARSTAARRALPRVA